MSILAIVAVVLVVLGLVLMRCKAPTRYYIGMVNKTGRDLNGVAVYYDGQMTAAAGSLVKGGKATCGPFSLSIPIEVEVRWIDQGVSYVPKVKLRDVVSPGFTKGTIYFIIGKDGIVAVKTARKGDIDAHARIASEP